MFANIKFPVMFRDTNPYRDPVGGTPCSGTWNSMFANINQVHVREHGMFANMTDLVGVAGGGAFLAAHVWPSGRESGTKGEYGPKWSLGGTHTRAVRHTCTY